MAKKEKVEYKDKLQAGDKTYHNRLKWNDALKRASVVMGRSVRGLNADEAAQIKQLAQDKGIKSEERELNEVAHDFYVLLKGVWSDKTGTHNAMVGA